MTNTNSLINLEDLKIIEKQNQEGFPLKKSVVIFFIVAWNLLFLSDIIPFLFKDRTEGMPIGTGIIVAVGLIFVSSILAIVAEKFRKIILKQNKNFDDIKKFAYFVAFISGIMFLAFTIGNLNK